MQNMYSLRTFQQRPELMVATKQERYILNLDFVRGVLRSYVCDLSEETLFRGRGDMNLMTREFLLGTKQAVSFRDSSNDN